MLISKSVRMRAGLRPSTMTRSASSTASSMLWVTMKMHLVGIFLLSHNSSSSERRFSAVNTSSAENGSSMKSTSGSTTSARANPTRCFMPPESSLGYAVSKSIETDGVDHAQCSLVALNRGRASRRQRRLDILDYREPREKGEALKDDGDMRNLAGHRLAMPEHLARRRRGQPGEHAQQRRLSRTRRTKQRNDLARADLQVCRRDHLNAIAVRLRVVLLDGASLDNRFRQCCSQSSANVQCIAGADRGTMRQSETYMNARLITGGSTTPQHSSACRFHHRERWRARCQAWRLALAARPDIAEGAFASLEGSAFLFRLLR